MIHFYSFELLTYLSNKYLFSSYCGGGGVCRTMDEKRNHMCQHMLSRGTFVSLQFPPLLLLIGIIPQEEISG